MFKEEMMEAFSKAFMTAAEEERVVNCYIQAQGNFSHFSMIPENVLFELDGKSGLFLQGENAIWIQDENMEITYDEDEEEYIIKNNVLECAIAM